MLPALPAWALWAIPAAGLAVAWAVRTGYQLTRRGPQLLDLGGIALHVVLRDLDDTIMRLEGMSAPDPELGAALARLVNSALHALQQSTAWGRALCPVLTQRVGEAIVDSMKLTEVGSPHWQELKAALDVFDRHVTKWAGTQK